MASIVPLISNKTGRFSGTVRVPGDKSMSHRALMLGLLAHDETMISGLLEGEDVIHTADAVSALGAKVRNAEDGLWRVFGPETISEPVGILDMGNSGTGARLMLGLIAGFPVNATLTGDHSLVARPMQRVMTPLSDMGARFISRKGGRMPLSVEGTKLRAIEYTLPVASAQVKSAILLAGLSAEGVTTVIEDRPTRDHTENMLRHFGINIKTERLEGGSYAISVEGGQKLHGCAVDIPSDPSSAAFPVVAACIVEGAEISLPGVGINERRTGLYDTLKEMGADISFDKIGEQAGEKTATIKVRGTGPLKGIDVPPERVPSMIDEFPILAMAASCADGTTRMTGLAELRVKESDRLKMVAEGLAACGVELEEGEDSLTIHGNGKPPQGGALINTAYDHRIAMSFLVLGMVTEQSIEVDDARAIETSFPGFAKLMNHLGADIAEADIDNVLKHALNE